MTNICQINTFCYHCLVTHVYLRYIKLNVVQLHFGWALPGNNLELWLKLLSLICWTNVGIYNLIGNTIGVIGVWNVRLCIFLILEKKWSHFYIIDIHRPLSHLCPTYRETAHLLGALKFLFFYVIRVIQQLLN